MSESLVGLTSLQWHSFPFPFLFPEKEADLSLVPQDPKFPCIFIFTSSGGSLENMYGNWQRRKEDENSKIFLWNQSWREKRERALCIFWRGGTGSQFLGNLKLQLVACSEMAWIFQSVPVLPSQFEIELSLPYVFIMLVSLSLFLMMTIRWQFTLFKYHFSKN